MPEISSLSYIPCHSYNTVIVGSGAAGYNAARKLHDFGAESFAVVTEGEKMGTSRNTGSDKQTYYKLTLAGEDGDSIGETAKTFFGGGAMHGDIALTNAACSVGCFCELAALGVPFPQNEYGEYAGYKTDHDPRMRATSCGPYTSKFMTETLEKSVKSKNIPVFDGYRVVKILKNGDRVCGIAALNPDIANEKNRYGLCIFLAKNIIWATGGPSAIYFMTVYPESQTCAHGMAFEAGARGVNLTESQYGLASLAFRWNLSGTYQQAIPRYFSVDEKGAEREFLADYFDDTAEMLGAIFLKGYEWPFDPKKLFRSGKKLSSLIDMAVFAERRAGRKVYMDFRRNPSAAEKNGSFDFSLLPDTARIYLENSGALLGKPIERLRKMNSPAISLYLNHGIDLAAQALEISVCAQHNNGGFDTDVWSESTSLSGFFPVGECAGTFGVYRPGGSALNATQVGSMRAAMKISRERKGLPDASDAACADKQICNLISFFENMSRKKIRLPRERISELRREYGDVMTDYGAFIRSGAGVEKALASVKNRLSEFENEYAGASPRFMTDVMINRDILITQYVYLSAIADYIARGGKSRGSYLITDDSIESILAKCEDIQTDTKYYGAVQEVLLENGTVKCDFSPVRPIPTRDLWFENVYNEYIKKK